MFLKYFKKNKNVDGAVHADDIISDAEKKVIYDKQIVDATNKIKSDVMRGSSNWSFLPYKDGYSKHIAKDLRQLGYKVDVDSTDLAVDLKPLYEKIYK